MAMSEAAPDGVRPPTNTGSPRPKPAALRPFGARRGRPAWLRPQCLFSRAWVNPKSSPSGGPIRCPCGLPHGFVPSGCLKLWPDLQPLLRPFVRFSPWWWCILGVREISPRGLRPAGICPSPAAPAGCFPSVPFPFGPQFRLRRPPLPLSPQLGPRALPSPINRPFV